MPESSEEEKEEPAPYNNQSFLLLSSSEKLRIGVLYAPIIIATIVAFILSTIVGNISVVLAGLGIVAYVFGLRHGVDADHIAAIDNVTRKLMQDGKKSRKPLTVGTWFSLGHSTIVVALIVALILATRQVAGSIPELQSMGAAIGTAVSGIFLWLIGLINVIIAFGIYGVYKELRREKLDPKELEELLDKRGLLNRYFSSLYRIIDRPWKIYPIGLLFGLGFDTSSEVALIAISVGVGVSSTVPLWTILVLPFMFTCGMVLVDTTDGVLMRLAYGWAFLKPVRKVYYNLTITIISILVAFLIGGVEVLQVLATEFKLSGSFWLWFNSLNFETLGFGIIALFLVSWLVSVVIYKRKGIDQNHGLTVS